ncbi:MAG: glycosyltransferase, partial [Flavobacteriaceae bacterium]|nr:glycosyltransferase [Flavobacteriaceae bacterium]
HHIHYQKKYPYIKLISEKDSGIYDALNKGVQLATGDLLGFVHSDDLLANNHIVTDLVNQLQNEQLDGVYGDLQYVDKVNINKVIRLWKSCAFKTRLLKQGWMPAHPTFFLKKEVYEKHGLFDLTYKIAADYDFMLRVLRDNSLKFGYLPKVITKMRVGGASNRSFKNIIQKTKEDYKAIRSNQVGGVLSIIRKNTSKLKQFILK